MFFSLLANKILVEFKVFLNYITFKKTLTHTQMPQNIYIVTSSTNVITMNISNIT